MAIPGKKIIWVCFHLNSCFLSQFCISWCRWHIQYLHLSVINYMYQIITQNMFMCEFKLIKLFALINISLQFPNIIVLQCIPVTPSTINNLNDVNGFSQFKRKNLVYVSVCVRSWCVIVSVVQTHASLCLS